jgi:hypothetical protein
VVVQNWDAEGKRSVRVLSLDVFTCHPQNQVTPRNGVSGLVPRALATVRKVISAVRK